ncbi:hypothetical protein HNQ92_002623 [Rhabdobacter roseus]|uniref:Uncharacterized protein n=1 Tax=Rhabdobacter roseus TaxID=1655419 RepID=A0A840TX14_9BACT|nr:hypothetical protein [Rhabdobacter roseus]
MRFVSPPKRRWLLGLLVFLGLLARLLLGYLAE